MKAVLWAGPCDGQELELPEPLPDYLSIPTVQLLEEPEYTEEEAGNDRPLRTCTIHHTYRRTNLIRRGRIFYTLRRDDVT